MNDFNFSIPQDIIFGKGSLKRLPEIAKKAGGKHALVISGKVLNKMGLVDKCIEYMKEAGYEADAFIETEANPSVDTVNKAADLYKKCGADMIVAFGGGSPMDVAKAVGVIVKYGGEITD